MHYFTMLTGLLATLLVFTPAGWAASQPSIEIVLGDRTVTLSRSELLQRADVTEIRIPREFDLQAADVIPRAASGGLAARPASGA